MKKENIVSQEFTLPFVGREEELKFLLDEYDQMLHAQYRSVWIEAPAGMGKTTLVEEFLKRLDVAHPAVAGCATSSLKPWIVHAHLRERSSNSLLSLVEALGTKLQTFTQAQQEKLFSTLTSFYRERVGKIVGGDIQSMTMEEGITTAGYILKKLSFYFPLVVIIEDLHVLKGEMSFYALRQLQALTEHVPMLVVYVSRSQEEKQLVRFREQVMKEGCKKYEVEHLKYRDVEKLFPGKGEKQIKEVMRLSGGNALLLRELVRNGGLDSTMSRVAAADQIIYYLTKELERFPKKDRQVISIAGILGEEFSERLLQEIAENKDFQCWNHDVLQRLERKGIIRRRKKILKRETEGGISLRVGVFSHALWSEAARKLYDKEKTWTDRKFAETIVPLFSQEDYPLLTDTELMVNLFEWLPGKKSAALIMYVDKICNIQSGWNLHSPEEYTRLLAHAHRSIVDLSEAFHFRFEKKLMWAMVDIITAEQFVHRWVPGSSVAFDNYHVLKNLLASHVSSDHEVFTYELSRILAEVSFSFNQCADVAKLKKAKKELQRLRFHIPPKEKNAEQDYCRNHVQAVSDFITGYQYMYSNPGKAVEKISKGIETAFAGKYSELQDALWVVHHMIKFSISQKHLSDFLFLTRECRKISIARGAATHFLQRIDLIEVALCLKTGRVRDALYFTEAITELNEKAWGQYTKADILYTLVSVYAYASEIHHANIHLAELFSEKFDRVDEAIRFQAIAAQLFYLEEWERFEALWAVHKHAVSSFEASMVIRLLEVRTFMCLLLGNEEGAREAISLLRNVGKKYVLLRDAVKRSIRTMRMFLALEGESLQITQKKFREFISNTTTLSSFDKAHYAQLFARIAVNYGHDPKEFKALVRDALKTFAALGLHKRVVVLSEKLHESQLLSNKELQRIRDKYKTDGAKPTSVRSVSEAQFSRSRMQESTTSGITVHCFGPLRATDPFGKEIVARKWGKQKAATSRHRRVVLELICARYERRDLTKSELLFSLYPQMRQREISEKKIYKLSRRLSVILPQLKESFLPYDVIEKTQRGYTLHSSVRVDLFAARENIIRAKQLSQVHPPSAVRFIRRALDALAQGEFAQGFHDARLRSIRQECSKLSKEGVALLEILTEKMTL